MIQNNREDYRQKEDSKPAVESTSGKGHTFSYKPSGKEEREIRRTIWDRYVAMRDSTKRKEAEKRWELGDKMYSMWVPEKDPEDWQADVVLPDAFSAVQTHLQETIQLNSRPVLSGVENSDSAEEYFCNGVYQYAMDKTDFDIETHKARHASAIRGDGFTIEQYRYETRKVKDPVSWKDGEIEYKERTIVDYDDVYTRWVDNYAVFFDDTVDDYKYATDCIYREVLSYDDYKAEYLDKPGYVNTDKVVPAASLSPNAGFFKRADDMGDNDVELLHYSNKNTDTAGVLANNVVILDSPLPSRHKELPIDKWTFYPIPGEFYGLGIPQIIYTLVEERRSGRNISLDRNKMQLFKMFLVNDLYDLDEDDMTPRPHGLIKVNTNGLPLNQVVMPLEYGDVPGSSIRMDETLLMEERRAHGLDDRPAQTAGGTATESAIISEAAQKRINLVHTQQNMMTLQSVGRKKWSNIQFFYPEGREEEIATKDGTSKKTVYKDIQFKGKSFKVVEGENKGEVSLQIDHIPEKKSATKLDKTFARFLEGNYDIIVKVANNVVEPDSVKFGKMSEVVMPMLNNPVTGQHFDGQKTVKRFIELAKENPADWLRSDGMTDEDLRTLAQAENELMAEMAKTGRIFVLPPTPQATEAHTEVHLNFINSAEFEKLPPEVQQVMFQHAMGEHQKRGGDVPGQEEPQQPEGMPIGPDGLPMGPPQGGGGNAVPIGMPGGPGAPMAAPPSSTVVGGDATAQLA